MPKDFHDYCEDKAGYAKADAVHDVAGFNAAIIAAKQFAENLREAGATHWNDLCLTSEIIDGLDSMHIGADAAPGVLDEVSDAAFAKAGEER